MTANTPRSASPLPSLSSSSSSPSSSLSTIKEAKLFRIERTENSKAEETHVLLNTISSASSCACAKLPSSKSTNKLIQREAWPICNGWFCLALLGVSAALCSLVMDFTIELLQKWHIAIYDWVDELESDQHRVYTFVVWTSYAVVLITSSAVLAHYFSPQTVGSGIPEMKTILRGFMLKEYLSFRTLILKMIGLTLSLGSGLPLGKEGPFVHVASALASQLSRFMTGLQGVYVNESRSQEMLAAGCAVGVACTFSTPIGGVLFSIEVTSTYFAKPTIKLDFLKTLFYLEELPIFALIGLVCGLAGALFIKCHKTLVIYLNRSTLAKKFMEKNWLLYPILVSFITSSITYPEGFGQFLSGQHKFPQTLRMLLSNCTWSASMGQENSCPQGFLDEWTAYTSASTHVRNCCNHVLNYAEHDYKISGLLYSQCFHQLWQSQQAYSCRFFIIGASFGRLVGEMMAVLFPKGIHSYRKLGIYPGIYAVVGAASFCGSVTHTISVAVIVFEMTGQLMHILPVMIAVFVANIVLLLFCNHPSTIALSS
ncbi:hypothetical protein KIN20_003659 [Parelaphostrongylus tenuis]|uniref:Chloride channel protein n=1 Tax=Parelaphostrongylus tenuis TaxID=148309 RepID=A0AAD5QHI7_PARTN|nr:hypothetical protein KIN20_003659 [Parelaphostrongylus tenuis]